MGDVLEASQVQKLTSMLLSVEIPGLEFAVQAVWS